MCGLDGAWHECRIPGEPHRRHFRRGEIVGLLTRPNVPDPIGRVTYEMERVGTVRLAVATPSRHACNREHFATQLTRELVGSTHSQRRSSCHLPLDLNRVLGTFTPSSQAQIGVQWLTVSLRSPMNSPGVKWMNAESPRSNDEPS